MVQTERAKEPVKPLSARRILNAARSVDEVASESFQVWSRKVRLSKPNYPTGDVQDDPGVDNRSRSYTDPYNTQLSLRFSRKIDGRIIAVRFIDHLVENGYNYHIARPPQLYDQTFKPKKLVLKQQELLLQPKDESEKIRFERERREMGYLLNYAGGRVEIVDEAGALKYYISGVLPQTKLILITTPIGGKRNQGTLYRSFLEKLSK